MQEQEKYRYKRGYDMAKWTEEELKKYRKLFCSEDISAACEDCEKMEFDIDNCYYEILGDI